MFTRKLLFALSCLISFSASAINIDIGTGTQTNTNTSYPAPYGNFYWGAKHQILILASELTAAGMNSGDINSLAFNVQSINGGSLDGFTISMKHTSANATTGLETGFTTVFGPQMVTPTTGYSTHVFSSPFQWNGASNLLIEICFNNNSFTQNDIILSGGTSFNSVVYYYQDAANVCATPLNEQYSNLRPNIRFDWSPSAVPPVASFSVNATNTCSGFVSLSDHSSNDPTAWLWDFGDGTTSTDENPVHTYTTDGVYTVTLTATNAFGNDTHTESNYITVNLSASVPIAANCTPLTDNSTLGFGVTNFTFNTLNNNSATSTEGYADFLCQQTTVFAGQTYGMSAILTGPSSMNAGVWIDFNNDGVFTDPSERIATASAANSISQNVTIPGNAVLNTPLRLRINADYDFSPIPTPCSNPQYGQAEDYTVIIEQDTSPPSTNFIASDTLTCSGVIDFTDLSSNIPIGWLWDFGDGNTSLSQNPSHTYATDGLYTVSLTSTNTFGSNTATKTAYIRVNTAGALTPASCTPSTLGYCCGYGIYRVSLQDINKTTLDGVDGYQDYSCESTTQVDVGSAYSLGIRTGINNQDTKIWIDFNNDGNFDNSEIVMDAPNQINPTLLWTVPASGVYDVPLRMRVMSDATGNIVDACSNQTFGQTEDYAVTIRSPISVEEQEMLNVQIYPNPTHRLLNIRSNKNIEKIEIYDLLGRNVALQNFSHNSLVTFQVDHLENGQYIVVLHSNGERISRSFIKQ